MDTFLLTGQNGILLGADVKHMMYLRYNPDLTKKKVCYVIRQKLF